jgi:PRC-barrel domain protein
MLIKAKTMVDYKLDSLDGEIGKVKEFYFDDRHWAIRYLVADTGNWLTGRQVLISPYALEGVMKEKEEIAVDLTKKQIEDSPSLESDKPVSRQFDEVYYGYHAFPTYWSGPYMWGSSPYILRDRSQWKDTAQAEKSWDPHLRSTNDVSGRHIQALDGEIGHVSDFIIDDENWAIRYLVVDTQNWWPGKRVLISPRWIERVSWSDSKVFVNLSRQSIKDAPEYTEDSAITRDYEAALHRNYDRKGYWLDEPIAKGHSTAAGRR